VDTADKKADQNVFYAMSYHLGCTEDDTEVKKAVDRVQEYYYVQDRRDWVEWADKTLMLCLCVCR
jgi:hypothetical protein